MKRNWKSILAVTGLVMLLSGCITQQTETTINSDGSGQNVIRTGLSSEALEFMQSSGGEQSENPFAGVEGELKNLPAEWNARAEEWKDETFEGVQITMEFKDMAMLNEQLSQFFEESKADEGSPTNGMFRNVSAKEENGMYIISADVDTTSATQQDPSSAQMFKDAVVFWKVTMPSDIEDFSAKDIATQEGNSVTWKFPLDKPGKYKVSVQGAKAGGLGGSSLPLILGSVGALLMLGGVGYMLMNRRKPAAAVSAGSYTNATYTQQPYDPNAGYGQQPNDPNDPNRR